ncbi:MAG: hypothetical protein WC732_04700 [Candidatus Omnitrophota bacterium]
MTSEKAGLNEKFEFYLNALRADIRRLSKKHAQRAVLVTGGLDSSLLACLARPFGPVLYFASLTDKERDVYNRQAALKCGRLAKRLNLRFEVAPVDLRGYRASRLKIQGFLRKEWLKEDEDLPAVYSLFKRVKMRQKPGTLVISGMGFNEFFENSKDALVRYVYEKLPWERRAHESMASALGLSFWAPYTRKRSLIFFKPQDNRGSVKDAFRHFLVSKGLVPEDIAFQPSLHSEIPRRFLRVNQTASF